MWGLVSGIKNYCMTRIDEILTKDLYK